MTEWMTIRQLYQGCTRAHVLRGLALRKLGSLSGMVFLGFALLALLALIMASLFFANYWLAVVLLVVILVFGMLGGLVVEDRLYSVFDSTMDDDRDVPTTFRRGFLGLRYLLFRQRLREASYFSPAILEAGLRCCDAERELAGARRPRVRWSPVIGFILLAMALAGGAPWVAQFGVDPMLLRLLAAAFSFVAMFMLALVLAQPRGESLEELRCLLAWALEDARLGAQGREAPPSEPLWRP